MITKDFATQVAQAWIEAWNSHDLARVLSHYTDNFEMTTPFIARLMGEDRGTLVGKDSIGSYWSQALAQMPDLHFELIEVLFSVNSICIYYKSVLGLRAVEWLYFDNAGTVCKASAHYNESVI
jgi:ketosteroid isomerase-like protein